MTQSTYKICKLNEVAWFQEGPGVRKSQFKTSGVKLLNVGNICDRELNLDKTSIYISEEEAYGRYKHFLIDEGDLLIASSGIKVDYFDKKITFARKEHLPLCMNTSTIRFKVIDKAVLDINYLRHFLASRYFTKQVQFHITGSAQLNFGPSHLNKMTIILPPLEEQKKIARILDKADEIRTKKRLANDKLDEFLKSTFISIFGDSKGNPNGFELKELQTISNVGSSKRVFVNELVEKGIPFYRGTEIGALAEGKEISPELFITEEHYKELCDCTGKVNQGDLLLPSICPDGRIWQVQDNTEFYFKDGRVLWIRPNAGENSTYIRYALKELFQSDYTHIASGTTFAELKIFILKTLNIMYPPMELQNKFAKIVEKVEAQKRKNELVVEQMDNLFNSLSQKAFKGEL